MKHGKKTLALPALLPLSLLAAATGCHYHDDDDDDHFTIVASGFEIEPNDESASPHFLGVLRHQESMVYEGHAIAGDENDPTKDPYDGFAIALTAPSEIEFALHFDDFDGELDVWIYDPALNDFALFFEDDFSPERGVFIVEEPVLDFQIVVFAYTGETDYTLEISARHIPIFSQSAPAATWRGSVREAAGFPSFERDTTATLRQRARDGYLGRPLADLDLDLEAAEAPFQVGAFHLIDSLGGVTSLPILQTPRGVPVVAIE